VTQPATETGGTRRPRLPWLALLLAAIAGAAGGALVMQRLDPPPPDRALLDRMVRESLLANPEIIPEAINRLQEREVEKLLASNRTAIETPFAGAWAGNPDGDVTLVEFFDFNCPFCREGKSDIDRLLAEDKGLKVVWRDFPVLSEESQRFALASLSAAKQGRYRQFLDAVFGNPGRLDEARLIAAIRKAGLDERQVAADLASPDLPRELESNLNLGRALGLTGTPSYIVGNRILSGAVGHDELKKAIAEARARPPARVPAATKGEAEAAKAGALPPAP
jgi:protein-disulfide isomerase